jgi:hypothetical protein
LFRIRGALEVADDLRRYVIGIVVFAGADLVGILSA